MADSIETEWQFDAADLERVRSWLVGQPRHAPLTFEQVREREQVDSYYDTSDWRLYHAGFSLRRRRTGDGYELTLKGLGHASDGPVARREISEASEDGNVPADDRGDGGEDRPASDRIRLICGRRSLQPLFDVSTRRRTFAVRGGDRQVAVVELDETTISSPGRPPFAFRRVEVELVDNGAVSEVEPFVLAMADACGLMRTSVSKYEMGLHAAGLDPAAMLSFVPEDAPVDPEEHADLDAGVFAYAWLRTQWAAFLLYEPGTRLGEDIEALHQMRVATRRLRAALRVFAPVLPAAFLRLRDELQWVGHELGAVRDLDVQIEEFEARRAIASWADSSALAPLVQAIERERVAERVTLVELLNSTRYDALVDEMSHLLRHPTPVAESADIRVLAAPVLARRFRQLRRDIAALNEASPPEEYHQVRIRAKQLRYSLEIFGALYGDPAARFAVAVKAVQDHLGEHQDADVGIARLRALVASEGASLPPETLVAVGRLMEQYAQRMVVLRSEALRPLTRVLRRWPAVARRVAIVARQATPPNAESPLPDGSSSARAVQPMGYGSDAGADHGADGDAGRSGEGARPRPPSVPPTPRSSGSSDVNEALRTARPQPNRPDEGGTLMRMRHLFQRD